MSLINYEKLFLSLRTSWLFKYKNIFIFLLALAFFIGNHPVFAQNIGLVDYRSNALKTFWMIIASILVFGMNAGFAMLEAGFCLSLIHI